ncbi:MAG: hypothetical protein QOJ40_303 [Verrucomicrobiota bacterium]
MKTGCLHLSILLVLVSALSATATVHYVDANGTGPVPPYTTWASAANNIQDAVNASSSGDHVLVTNGVYNTGGQIVFGSLSNRVAVTKPVVLESVNGPNVTAIEGYRVPDTVLGDTAVRCVYLTNGASLIGFMITNGATRGAGDEGMEQSGGGILCGLTNVTVSNCIVIGNSANDGGGIRGGTVDHCSFTGNSGGYGGGAHLSTLTGCTFSNNTALEGGGAYSSTLDHCSLAGNFAHDAGGGANSSTVNNCLMTGNTASICGGAAYVSTLNNCTITKNSAGAGGGVGFCEVNGSVLTGNSSGYGGATLGGALNNCAITGNFGVGALDSHVRNCIIYYNSDSNWALDGEIPGSLNYCCTTPLPDSGAGNFATEPQLASGSHISAVSPCRGAGSVAYTNGVDIDGEAWLTPPSVGCDEFYAATATGNLIVSLTADHTNVAAGFVVQLAGSIEGICSASRWEFGDGNILSNRPFASHAWAAAGDYPVVLRAYNADFPGGLTATQMVHVAEGIYYVVQSNPASAAPYDSWSTAATNIQDAVDAAIIGGTVLVSNGVYNAGGRVIYNLLTNRVAINKIVTVRSVNGPAATFIVGYQDPATTFETNSVRCVYLTNGAALSGFTLTNGSTLLINCECYDNGVYRGGGVWCESVAATVSNCVITGCRASDLGGGVVGGTFNNCLIAGNHADLPISGYGGGAEEATLNGCELVGNSSFNLGGAGIYCTFNNCSIHENSTGGSGGGACSSTLNNCTVVGNSTPYQGGGVGFCTVNNCIIYHNSCDTGPNYFACSLNNCCTTPLPDSGVGNFTTEPQLASASHTSAGSPCRGAGSVAYTNGLDIDAQAWLTPPSVGCDEFYAATATGSLLLSIAADHTNVAAGFAVRLTGSIEGICTASRWEFGDGNILSNRPYASHAWAAAGDYPVVLRAYNADFPGGLTATQMVHVADGIYYVVHSNTGSAAPYDSWSIAATNIQDAVDAAIIGGTVLVSNGVYNAGGRAVGNLVTNRVVINNFLSVRSVNGPAATIIDGSFAMRCVYVTNGTALVGFTVTNGIADYGGGMICDGSGAVISNCVIIGNFGSEAGGVYGEGRLFNCTLATNYSAYAGGAANCTLVNCRIIGNSSDPFFEGAGGVGGCVLNNCLVAGNTSGRFGGGAANSTLNNCTIVGNYASQSGGGAVNCALNNCILYYNTALADGLPNYFDCGLDHCCTEPLPGGPVNITNAPLFVDQAGGDFRLQSSSPCINAGYNPSAPAGPDLDGNPRIRGGTVDIGAYEFQTPTSLLSYAWLQQYGFPTDGSADFTDPDSDHMNNWQEWRAGTDPTNVQSFLQLLTPVADDSGVTLTWQSGSGVFYFLQRSTNLTQSFSLLQTDIAGSPGTTGYTDTTATNGGPYFYRVGVQ